ncbi:MAG: anhydro-N-acetylmuramic acid kinase [Aureispira sp.]|nr:anhydro-N-acetylmuramic acid kinase [Aureispira sp.]
MAKKIYKALGLMSGSSLDGLDIVYTSMQWENGKISDWQLLAADTLSFSEKWHTRLLALPLQNGLVYAQTDMYLGYYFGALVNQFIQKYKIQDIDFVASHGHTIYHDPDRRFTAQIGNGGALAATISQDVICDFRTQDVALNGEGAPLAPLADKYLFEGYDFYLNIGGIANISCNANGRWVAFDVCPANQVLNALANELEEAYDQDGALARSGDVDSYLLEEIRRFDYYQQVYPKSLGNGWIREQVLPVYEGIEIPIVNKLATTCEHIAIELTNSIIQIIEKEKLEKPTYKLLATGGGAFNGYLIECMQNALDASAYKVDIIVPETEIVDYKEALLMALLGVLRCEGVANSLSTVTGADRDTINGAIYKAK